jgi:hypothetical protein
VAKFTRRPLLRLTVADIGTDERDMEDNLGEWFQRGADWGAIILLDEADVFLEKRQVKDLERNSLVSGNTKPYADLISLLTKAVFLSSMEYYTGMLFLVGSLPSAFPCSQLSRIDNQPHRPNRRRLPLPHLHSNHLRDARYWQTAPYLGRLPQETI